MTLRSAVPVSHLRVTPGVPATCDIEVTNTSDIIDGVTVELTGLDPTWVQLLVPVVSLFPDATGILTLQFLLPMECLAGEYLVTARVKSVLDPERWADQEFWVSVQPLELAWLELRPAIVNGKKKASYKAVFHNEGNVPLDVAVSASDLERACRIVTTPTTMLVPARDKRAFEIEVRGPRPFFGQSATRELTVRAEASDTELEAKGTFVQKPRIARGVLTMLILAAIIALWAFIFLYVLDALRAKPAPTKSVPKSTQESLKAAQAAAKAAGIPLDGPVTTTAGGGPAPGAAGATTTTAAAGAAGSGGGAAAAAAGGANPKVDLTVIGGALSGTVRAKSTNAPAPGVTVEALRIGKDGPVPAGSAATGEDGVYAFPALLPGDYIVKFSGPGYQDVWYPAATSDAGAAKLTLTGPASPVVADTTIIGNVGSLTGTILAPNAPPGTTITVTLLRPAPADGSTTATSVAGGASNLLAPTTTASATAAPAATQTVATVTAGSDGKYAIPNVDTPGTYTLRVEAAGYQATETDVTLAAGENKIVNTIALGTKPGKITGIVTDSAGKALGNAVVTLSAGPITKSVNTPTSGSVGAFEFDQLDTPKTYVVSVTLDGYDSQARAVRLDPGADQKVPLQLVGGAGTVHGIVTDASGAAVGGATVTVTNGTFTAATATLTTPDAAGNGAGTYTVTGLPTPGVFTVTVSAPGLSPETIQVTLGASAAATNADLVLPSATGTIDGTVSIDGTGAGQVTVQLSDGVTPRLTASATKPAGSYTFTGVVPGAYTLTFSKAGAVTQVVSVTVNAADHITKDVDLEVASAANSGSSTASPSTTAATP